MAAPVFDAVAISTASGLQTSTITQSWTHVVGAGANNVGIIAVEATNNGSGGFVPTGTPTAAIGSSSLTYLGSILMGNTAIAGWIEVFAALGVPTGSQTATYTSVHSGQNLGGAFGTSYTYTGVSSFGSLQTNQGVSTADTVTVTSAVGHLVWGSLANYQTGTYSSLSFTARLTNTAANPFFVAGDMAGASSVNVSGTESGSFHWAAVGLDLLPVPAVASPGNFNQALCRSSLY